MTLKQDRHTGSTRRYLEFALEGPLFHSGGLSFCNANRFVFDESGDGIIVVAPLSENDGGVFAEMRRVGH